MIDLVRPFRVTLNVKHDGELCHGYDTGDVVNWADYQTLQTELSRVQTLLAMVAVHLDHPELGGLSDEQEAAIGEWYGSYRRERGEI